MKTGSASLITKVCKPEPQSIRTPVGVAVISPKEKSKQDCEKKQAQQRTAWYPKEQQERPNGLEI